MLELGISQAQGQFTQLLTQKVLIIDKKAHHKKAVILPYDEYQSLLARANSNKESTESGVFSKFIGILDNEYKTDDSKYNDIVK
jgi:hypothetical protein